MSFRKIAGPLTLYSGATAGSPMSYEFEPSGGGEDAGQLSYMVRVVQAQTASTVKVALKLEHGPDRTVSTSHSTPIASTLVGTPPLALVGDAGSGMFLPFLHPILEIDLDTGSGAEWVVVEVYELRKAL